MMHAIGGPLEERPVQIVLSDILSERVVRIGEMDARDLIDDVDIEMHADEVSTVTMRFIGGACNIRTAEPGA